MSRIKILFLSAALAAVAAQAQTEIYVAHDGPAGGAGTSWADAYTNLPFALQYAPSNSVVYVKGGGTYTCTNVLVRTNNLQILGGYEGTNTVDLPGPYDAAQWPTELTIAPSANNLMLRIDGRWDVTLGRLNFTGGRSNAWGGAVNIGRITNLFVFDCNFTSNSAQWGGAVVLTNTENATFSNCVFSWNISTNDGGAFYAGNNTNLLIRACSFQSGRSTNAGALYLTGSTNVSVLDCGFSGNTTRRWGGAVFVHSVLEAAFSNCAFSGNMSTNDGGAMFIQQSQNLRMYDSSILSGYSTNGGGMFVTNSSALLSGVTFMNNIATNGGALFVRNGSTVTVERCVIRGNQGRTRGGGIYLTNSMVLARNTVVAGNYLGESLGQAAYNDGGVLLVDNCTFARHQHEGVNNAGGVFHATNSIFWEYTAVNDLVGVPAANLYYCNVGSGLNEGNNGCVSTNPLFQADWDFHLKSQQGRWDPGMAAWVYDDVNSPCIDAGDPASAWAIEPAPNGGRVNMGAYGNTEQASKTLQPPTLVVDPAGLTVRVMRGQAASNNFFRVSGTNSLDRPMLFTNTSLAAWLTPRPSSGVATNDLDGWRITNSHDSAGMAVGVYTGRVVVSATDLYGNQCQDSPATNTTLLVVGREPSLAVSTNRLSRIVNEGNNAASQLFDVWNQTADYGLRYSIATNVPWLSVSPATGVSYGVPHTLTVSYNTASLPGGTHTGRITVNAVVEEYPAVAVTNAPMHIDVTVTVLSRPALTVSPGALTNFVTAGYNADRQSLEIWNSSAPPRSSMLYTVATNAPWIRVSPNSGSTTGEHDTVNVWYTTDSMPVGQYTGQVIVTSPGSSPTQRVISVYMNVSPSPETAVNVTTITNTILKGFNASAQTFQVWNSSDAPRGRLNYTIFCDASWLSLSAYSGSTVADTNTITITYNTSGLAGGGYEALITVSGVDPYSGIDAGTRYIRVVLEVMDMPLLKVSPDAMITNTMYEGTSGGVKTLDVWNDSGYPVASMDFMCIPNQTWLSVSPSSGSVRETAERLSFVFDARTLEPGVYSCQVAIYAWEHVTGTLAINSPKTIEARLTVLPRTPLNIESPSISGLPYIGRTLSLAYGIWDRQASLSMTQQWQKADTSAGFNTVNIPGANSMSYTVTTADAGKFIRALVTATDSSYAPTRSASKDSGFVNRFKIRALPGDYDSDGVSDAWFYHQAAGNWMFRYSSTRQGAVKQLGWSETLGVPGDYDGDGYMDIAVYHQAAGIWYILTYFGQLYIQNFGWAEAMPVPGDYDGDGATDLAVYHPASGCWYIMSLSGRLLAWALPFGWSEAMPMPADYDGDGATDIAVYHQAAGMWYCMSLSGRVLAWALHFGWADAMAVPADYEGNGSANIAVYYMAGNTWYILHSNNAMGIYTFGTSNGAGLPVPADYDGDGVWDMATVHANGDFAVWCLWLSSHGYFGYSYQFSTGEWR